MSNLMHKEVNSEVIDWLHLAQGKDQSSNKDTVEAVIKVIININKDGRLSQPLSYKQHNRNQCNKIRKKVKAFFKPWIQGDVLWWSTQ